jgi:hypothetical protein
MGHNLRSTIQLDNVSRTKHHSNMAHRGALSLKREHQFQFNKCNLIEVLIAQHKT